MIREGHALAGDQVCKPRASGDDPEDEDDVVPVNV